LSLKVVVKNHVNFGTNRSLQRNFAQFKVNHITPYAIKKKKPSSSKIPADTDGREKNS